jgi:hypothetical protein
MSERMQIVIAWTEQASEFVAHRRTDLGERPIMREVTIAKACTWLLDGDATDLARAQAYAATNGGSVYTYPVDYENSLADARRMVLS